MAYHFTELPHMFHTKPKALADYFMELFVEHNANLPKIWEKLDISAFAWYDYVRRLGIKEQLISLRRGLSIERRGRRPGYSTEKAAPRPTPSFVALAAEPRTSPGA